MTKAFSATNNNDESAKTWQTIIAKVHQNMAQDSQPPCCSFELIPL